MLEDLSKGVIISGITIGDSHVEISFFETRDQAERAGLIKNLILDRTRFAVLVNEVVDAAIELVDAGLLEIRSPADSLDPRKRLSGQEPSED